MIKSLYTEITSKIRCLLGGNYMKKGFLSVLLTLFMMLAVMPVTAYAVPNMRYCDYCNGEPREAYISGYQLRNQNFIMKFIHAQLAIMLLVMILKPIPSVEQPPVQRAESADVATNMVLSVTII